MSDWLLSFLHFFSLPEVGLPAIFIVAFISATVLPMATEPVLFGFVKLNPEQFWLAIIIASIGNTLGGMLTYWMGYGIHHAYVKQHTYHQPKHFLWLQQLGAPVLLLSWLPIIGDALCVMAGWLKLPWRGVLLYMFVGKFLRFAIMTLMLLWMPDDFWTHITQWFSSF